MEGKKRGFTLIELLVVISIIGLLSSVVLVSLNTARAKARDSQRRASLAQLSTATQMRYLDTGQYPNSAGWFTNTGHGGLDAALVPTYIVSIQDDPISPTHIFMYWRKDYNISTYCSGAASVSADRYGFYARLENPSATDLATLTDSFDLCVQTRFGMNYKRGN